MIHLPSAVRVYLATSPCDMRRSFDGLHALVSAVLKLDAFAGAYCPCFPRHPRRRCTCDFLAFSPIMPAGGADVPFPVELT